MLLTLSLILSCFSGPCPWMENYVTKVEDFPKPGIRFNYYDKLFQDPAAFDKIIKTFAKEYRSKKIDAIAALDARGFIFGSALAYELKLPFVLIRKAGKLPGNLESISYDLHYGSDTLELDVDGLPKGSKVLIVDDVIATGHTAKAACQLIEKAGSHVFEVACLMELSFLHGRETLNYPLYSLYVIHDN